MKKVELILSTETAEKFKYLENHLNLSSEDLIKESLEARNIAFQIYEGLNDKDKNHKGLNFHESAWLISLKKLFKK